MVLLMPLLVPLLLPFLPPLLMSLLLLLLLKLTWPLTLLLTLLLHLTLLLLPSLTPGFDSWLVHQMFVSHIVTSHLVPWYPPLCTSSVICCLTPPQWSHSTLILFSTLEPNLPSLPNPAYGDPSPHRSVWAVPPPTVETYQVITQCPQLHPGVPLASHQLSNPPPSILKPPPSP